MKKQKITESELRQIIKESVRKVLKESKDMLYLKSVECYDEEDDIVFVTVPTKYGGDGEARYIVKNVFPKYDIIDILDGDGIEVGNLYGAQRDFVEQGYKLSDEPISKWEDLLW